ncbi:lactoylglutathione lyase [Candidatus Termititenax persephonae]|uniref:Lactoylglutathione lyase n=1 Tax=Candidatus Termititenax persephonae TaxID=2218525 RepID=A0A388THM6_9BACT|nr:lactoylglutathione lyase [Candidatus Termititenax persephonae]
MNVHHVGYLVRDLASAQEEFLRLGFVVKSAAVRDFARGVDICFIENGGYVLELISPIGAESPLHPLLKKIQNSPYHICYEVEDLPGACARFSADGYMLIGSPAPAPAISGGGGVMVCFLFSPQLGILELLQKNN